MQSIKNAKKIVRNQIIQKRDSMTPEEKKLKDEMIRQRLKRLREYKDAKNVLMFAPFRSEINTYSMIRDALTAQKTVILPKVDSAKRNLLLLSILDVNELKNGYLNIPEPDVGEEREVSPDRIDFVLMPGVAFDEQRGRLGYGGGYYDRLISRMKKKPPLVAIAYEEQITSTVPVTEHDIRPDKIVTDKRVIGVNNN